MPSGELSVESDNIVNQYSEHPEWVFENLPLVKTGCDSYGAVYPKFKDLSPILGIEQILHEVEITRRMHEPIGPPNGIQNSHIVITGGEPLLGWQKAYPELLDRLAEAGYRHITFETNGTQQLTEDFRDYLYLNHISGKRLDITFSVSPKLECSGESRQKALKSGVVNSYSQFGTVYLKFVVATQQDLDDVNVFVEKYRADGFSGEVYLMPMGGTEKEYFLNAPQVAELAMHSGYRYSPRLQVDIWQNAHGT